MLNKQETRLLSILTLSALVALTFIPTAISFTQVANSYVVTILVTDDTTGASSFGTTQLTISRDDILTVSGAITPVPVGCMLCVQVVISAAGFGTRTVYHGDTDASGRYSVTSDKIELPLGTPSMQIWVVYAPTGESSPIINASFAATTTTATSATATTQTSSTATSATITTQTTTMTNTISSTNSVSSFSSSSTVLSTSITTIVTTSNPVPEFSVVYVILVLSVSLIFLGSKIDGMKRHGK